MVWIDLAFIYYYRIKNRGGLCSKEDVASRRTKIQNPRSMTTKTKNKKGASTIIAVCVVYLKFTMGCLS